MEADSEAKRGGRPEAILIAGPTASGKSALAVRLAQHLHGTVINCDSMQVYRDLRIITARPTLEEEASAAHRLFGEVDAACNWSVGLWLQAARQAIAETKALGRLPILAGGTGLYFKALTQGLSAMPQVPAAIRAGVRDIALGLEAPELHRRLAERDPLTAAKLRSSDRQRIIRGLEIVEATGRPLAEWQEGRRETPLLDRADCVALFLAPERDALRARIDTRFDAMLAEGALEEVRALGARKLDPALPAMRAHGVPWLLAHLSGEISLEEAGAGAKADTRRYAKRQFTWFRHQMPGWTWCLPEAGEKVALDAIRARNDGSPPT
ncbi:tRNA dimethylallyltransferase [Rhizobiales bacterium GAS113]|nr:tRNA dimethylallyltransferase [Rhizobiales bacterium GAS113]